jgi:ABC-type phosphate/phosphonate transport system substrate-binding protein
MESQTGVSGTLVQGGDPGCLARQLKEDKCQLAVFHGIEFGWARQRCADLKPLVVAVCGQYPLHAYLVVRADSGIKGFADLRDKKVALCRKSREHCRLFLERRCQAHGQLQQFLAKVTAPADAEDALDDAVDGTVDATVVDGPSLQRFKGDKPERSAQLKVAVESEPFPPAVIAYVPGSLDENTLQRFHDGLIQAHQNKRGKELLTMCRITRFDEVPRDFENLLTEIMKAYPPPTALAKK